MQAKPRKIDELKVKKDLHDKGVEIADAMTTLFSEENKKWGFVLFLVDYGTGIVNYTSDIAREDVVGLMKAWIKREEQ